MKFTPAPLFATPDPSVRQMCDEMERRGYGRNLSDELYRSTVFEPKPSRVGQTIFNVLIGLSAFVVALTASVYAFNHLDWRKSPTQAQTLIAQQIKSLQSDVLNLSEQNQLLKVQVNDMTADNGVLAQIVDKLKEQRKINTSHNAALRQVMAATGAISSSLPPSASFGDIQIASRGAQRVQVTPVSNSNVAEAPKTVIVTPSSPSKAARK